MSRADRRDPEDRILPEHDDDGCPDCGAKVWGADYCPECGASMGREQCKDSRQGQDAYARMRSRAVLGRLHEGMHLSHCDERGD